MIGFVVEAPPTLSESNRIYIIKLQGIYQLCYTGSTSTINTLRLGSNSASFRNPISIQNPLKSSEVNNMLTDILYRSPGVDYPVSARSSYNIICYNPKINFLRACTPVAGKEYEAGECFFSGVKYYKSISETDNYNNPPGSSPDYWEEITTYSDGGFNLVDGEGEFMYRDIGEHLWSSEKTYTKDDEVLVPSPKINFYYFFERGVLEFTTGRKWRQYHDYYILRTGADEENRHWDYETLNQPTLTETYTGENELNPGDFRLNGGLVGGLGGLPTVADLENEYASLFGNMSPYIPSEGSLCCSYKYRPDLLTNPIIKELVEKGTGEYTNTVDISAYRDYIVGTYDISCKVDLSVMYVKEGNLHPRDLTFGAFDYVYDESKDLVVCEESKFYSNIEDDVEVSFVDGVVTVVPRQNDVTSCIITNCVIIYGNLERHDWA